MSCDPANISGQKLWLKGDDAATGTITTWADASGNGNDATAVDTPQGVASVLNGHKIVRFDGVDDHFTFGDFISGFTGGEVFIVIKIDADPPPDATRSGLWHFGGTDNTHYPFTNALIYEIFGSNVRRDGIDPAADLATWKVYSVSANSSSWLAHLDGTQIHSEGSNTVAFTTTPKLGISRGGVHFLDGDVAEMILYNRSLTTTERGNVWHYLAEKYALTIANTVSCDAPASKLLKPNNMRPAFFKPGLGR